MKHPRSLAVQPDGTAAAAPAAETFLCEDQDLEPSSTSVDLWTDGACKGNPGPGGWGALLRSGTNERELFGGAADTTNNRMELIAVIEGLRAVKRSCRILVHTDSKYVMMGITEWMANWRRRGWKTAEGKPVKNLELWQQLDEQVRRHTVQWKWVRGHSGDAGNERADALANRGVELARQGG